MKNKLKAFLRFLISRMLWLNILAAIIVFYAIFYFLMDYLHDYTRQDESERITVGWYYGMKAEDATRDIEKKGLVVEVDSVFLEGVEPGTVFTQEPLPTDSGGIHVKKGRTVNLKVQAFRPPLKTLPKMDVSRRLAEPKLRGLGLNVVVKYIPGTDKDRVVEAFYDGMTVERGDKVPRGATIILNVQKGNALPVGVPVITGLTITEATRRLTNASLTLYTAECIGCETPEDSAQAVVVRQDPYGGEKSVAPAGSEVMVWFSVEGEGDEGPEDEPEEPSE